MRLVVTGRAGQLARSLTACAAGEGIQVATAGRPDLDLAQPATIGPALAALRPDIIVNAAAFTAVDKAESEEEAAFAINATGAGAVAAAARTLGVPVIQISTDYVFDGTAGPYREEDPTEPANAYGRSKLAGERAVAEAHADHVILRTSWVYGAQGGNFVATMLRLAGERDEVSVVADQIGAPTSADDLAAGIVQVARSLLAQPDKAKLRGVFHLTGQGETSWAGFAEAIFAASAQAGGPVAAVRPIPTEQYPTPARRPADSRLDCSRIAAVHGVRLPHWRESVAACVGRIVARRG